MSWGALTDAMVVCVDVGDREGARLRCCGESVRGAVTRERALSQVRSSVKSVSEGRWNGARLAFRFTNLVDYCMREQPFDHVVRWVSVPPPDHKLLGAFRGRTASAVPPSTAAQLANRNTTQPYNFRIFLACVETVRRLVLEGGFS